MCATAQPLVFSMHRGARIQWAHLILSRQITTPFRFSCHVARLNSPYLHVYAYRRIHLLKIVAWQIFIDWFLFKRTHTQYPANSHFYRIIDE